MVEGSEINRRIETYNRLQIANMSPDQLEELREKVRRGEAVIVRSIPIGPSKPDGEEKGMIDPTTPSQENVPWLTRVKAAFRRKATIGERKGMIDPTTPSQENVPSWIGILAALHPRVIEAWAEAISTEAEKKAALTIASGNLEQLELLNAMFEMFKENPTLWGLLLTEAENYLPPGVKFTDLTRGEQIGLIARIIARLTSMPAIIHWHERAMGKNARRVAALFAGVDAALQMVPVAKQLPKATQSLEELNRNLGPYMNADVERRRRMAEHAQRKIETEVGKYVAIGTGVVTKAGAALVAGTLSLPFQVASLMEKTAELQPLAVGGGLLGITIYGLYAALKLHMDLFTWEFLWRALASGAVGALGLPMVVGVIEGLAKRSS